MGEVDQGCEGLMKVDIIERSKDRENVLYCRGRDKTMSKGRKPERKKRGGWRMVGYKSQNKVSLTSSLK